MKGAEEKIENLYKLCRMGIFAKGGKFSGLAADSWDPKANSVRGLDQLIKHRELGEDSVVLELGSFAGVSSELFALRCEKVYCVDPWCMVFDDADSPEVAELYAKHPFPLPSYERQKWSEDRFDERCKLYDNIIKIKNFSFGAVDSIEDESIDLLYIDSNHDLEAVRKDILDFYPKIKMGGILAGHDYSWGGVRRCCIYLQDQLGQFKKYPDDSWSFPPKKRRQVQIPEGLKE